MPPDPLSRGDGYRLPPSQTVIVIGAAEVVGASLFVYSMLSRRHLLKRDELRTIQVAPLSLGRGSGGMALAGRF